jgi:hypothetical protein
MKRKPSPKKKAAKRHRRVASKIGKSLPPDQFFSARELINEAFTLFCDPSATKRFSKGELLQRRMGFVRKSTTKAFVLSHTTPEEFEDALLSLLQKVLSEPIHPEVAYALRIQSEHRLSYELSALEDELRDFLQGEREAIETYLIRKAAQSLKMGDRRSKPLRPKKTSENSAFVTVAVAVLAFCYRQAPELTNESTAAALVATQSEEFRREWRHKLRQEKKLRSKNEGRNFRTGRGNALTHTEAWLLKHWADPRLPLCVMSLNDIVRAADLSPALPKVRGPGESKTVVPVTSETIRKIIARAGLSRLEIPAVVNVQDLFFGWPPFDYDINPDIYPKVQGQILARTNRERAQLRTRFSKRG